VTLQPPEDPYGHVLASDAEREATVERLRAGHADGRITLDELHERSELAYRARTAGELSTLTRDLPSGDGLPMTASPLPVAGGGETAGESIVAVFSGADRKGHWRVPRRSRAVAVFGGINVDMGDAQLSANEVRVDVVAVFGGVEIIVPEGVEVQLTGFSLFGGKTAKVAASRPGAPVVRVHCTVVFGGVEVKSRPRGNLVPMIGPPLQ
jgi:hypothetical protein